MGYLNVYPLKSAFQFRPDIETRLGGLVVSHVLCSNADSIYRVFQESMEAVFGRNCSYIQAERLIVVRTNQHFFSPITDKIALK